MKKYTIHTIFKISEPWTAHSYQWKAYNVWKANSADNYEKQWVWLTKQNSMAYQVGQESYYFLVKMTGLRDVDKYLGHGHVQKRPSFLSQTFRWDRYHCN